MSIFYHWNKTTVIGFRILKAWTINATEGAWRSSAGYHCVFVWVQSLLWRSLFPVSLLFLSGNFPHCLKKTPKEYKGRMISLSSLLEETTIKCLQIVCRGDFTGWIWTRHKNTMSPPPYNESQYMSNIFFIPKLPPILFCLFL